MNIFCISVGFILFIWHNPRHESRGVKDDLRNQIRQSLIRYLRNEFTLDQLEDWLAQHSWNMHLDSDLAAQKLASAIELRLAEHSSGHLGEFEMREELRALVSAYATQLNFGSAVMVDAEPANNIVLKIRPQVVAFPFRAAVASQEAFGYADTSRAMVSG